tara:strand:- start:421 stop:1002 length:582 start_codon:yes stop_codon:yes gene_type:complete
MSSEIKADLIKDKSGTKTLATLSSSAVTLDSSVVFPAGGTGNPISVAVICDEKSANESAGSSSSYNGSWEKKELNTELSDPDNIVSIASDQFTLGAGTYLINWSSPMYMTNRHQSRLYDVTGSTVLESGSSEYSFSDTSVCTRSMGSRIHTITANNVYEIQHQTDFTRSDGLGVASMMGIPNIYTLVTIYKLK